MTLILIVGGLTLLASFLCSLFEAALYAVTPAKLEVLKKKGVPGARRLARMRDNVEEPIAAILSINTVAHTVGSAWCGAMVAEAFGPKAVGIFAAVYTVLVLVLTEIIPKSFGVRYASVVGPRIAWPLQWMIWLAWPIARPARAFMSLLTKGKHDTGPTEEEVMHLSSLAAKHGLVRMDESRLVQNALRLDRVVARDLCTPRTVVETLPADLRVADVPALEGGWTHSRVPLTDGDKTDDVIGLVYRREVFDLLLQGPGDKTLRDLVHPLRFVPETMPAHELLDLFLRHRRHLMAVVDEYGGLEGVVTLEDVLEELLGQEIVDEHDEFEDMQELARKRHEARRPADSPEPAADDAS